jgi:putative transposase
MTIIVITELKGREKVMTKEQQSQKKEGLKEIPDIAWEKIEKILPCYDRKKAGGRPRSNIREIMNGILYVLRTGCQWKMIPREYGSGSTCHRYFQEWEKAGVFRKFWRIMVYEYDEKKG